MSGNMSRNKGKRGEREVINQILSPVVRRVYDRAGLAPPELQRNLLQSHKGGHDIVGLEWLAPEVKFQETLQVPAWWRQAVSQAGQDRTPVLLFRQSRKAWRVMMWGYIQAGERRVKTPVEISLDVFILWLEVALTERLKELQQ